METGKVTYSQSAAGSFGRKALGYFRILKFRLSLLVVFSSLFGYMMAPEATGFVWTELALLALGGFMVTGASNILNQVFETEYDRIMSRTMGRPLPRGVLRAVEAVIYALLLAIGGVILLWTQFGTVAALLSIIALLSYAFVYTPMKRINSVSVIIGAFPGAMPPLIGYAAASGSLSAAAVVIFLIQFLWQFPHFWAIAWLLDDDYKKAGFHMLPNGGGRVSFTAFIILVYTALLIPAWVLPWRMEIISGFTAVMLAGLSVLFTIPAIMLLRDLSRRSALLLMFGSFIYLPVVQIAMLADKLQG